MFRRKARKALRSVLVVIVLLFSLYGALRSPVVQTYITQKLAGYIGKRLHTVVKVEGVDIRFFRSVMLDGIYVEDLHRDTLLYISRIVLGFDHFNRKTHELFLDEALINGATLKIKKYLGEEEHNFTFILDAFRSGDSASDWPLVIATTQLRKVGFSYKDENSESSQKNGVNYKNLQINDINTFIENLNARGDSVFAHIQELAFKEKSGFAVEHLSGYFKSSPRTIDARQMDLATRLSHVQGELNLSYSGYGDLIHFIDSVRIDAEFARTGIQVKDLAYFAQGLKDIDDSLTFDGRITGTIAKLKGRNIDMSYGSDTRFKGELSLTGLPDFEETFIQLDVKQLATSQRDIARLPVPPFGSGKKLEVPAYIKKLGDFNFKGDFTGFYNDFVAYGRFQTALGTLRSDLSLKRDPDTKVVRYSGQVASGALNLGRFFDAESNVGMAAFDINVLGDGLDKNSARAELDGIIKGITLFKYDYKNIELKGEFANRRFDGFLSAKDENLDMVFNGQFDFSSSPPRFNFTSDIRHANLNELKLISSVTKPVFSVKVASDFSGNSIDNIIGEIHLKDLKYRDAKLMDGLDFYPVGDISLSASVQEGVKNLKLNAAFAEAEVKGVYNMLGLAGALAQLLSEMLPNADAIRDMVEATKGRTMEQDFEYAVLLKEPSRVLDIVSPEIRIAPNATLTGMFNSARDKFTSKLAASKVEIRAFTINDLESEIYISTRKDDSVLLEPSVGMHAVSHFGRLSLGERASLDDVNVAVEGRTNALQFTTNWDNHAERAVKGKLSGDVRFTKGKVVNEVEMQLQPTEIIIGDTIWTVSGENRVRYNENYLGVSGLKVSNNMQEFAIDGANSRYDNSGIDLVWSNLNMGLVERLLNDDRMLISGTAAGKATLYGLFTQPYATGELSVSELLLNQELLGNAMVSGSWKEGTRTVSVSGSITKNNLEDFSMQGEFQLGQALDGMEQVDADFYFTKFRLRPFRPFVSTVFSNIAPSTSVSGTLSLGGSYDKLLLRGNLNVHKGGFRLAALNTDYTFADEVLFTDNEIVFEETVINDMMGNRAIASGRLIHNHFRDWSLDIQVSAENIHCLNTDLRLNKLYYGQAYATGDIRIYGPFNNIAIDVDARTDKHTRIYIPLNGGEELDEKTYVMFVNGSVMDSMIISKEQVPRDMGKYPQLKMNIEATELAEVQVIFDEIAGDILKATGRGDLQFKVDHDGTFNIYGTYEIQKGDYLFTLKRVINKRFKIEPGGTITWNGNPYDAMISLNAIYSLNTSLYNLTGEDKDKRRIPVECHLKMSGALMNPDIAFEIVFPEMGAGTSSNAWMFNTDQQINWQVFSLLVLGKFQRPEGRETGAVSGVQETPSELLSNQLSNWLSNISQDFDIGVKYRAGDEITEKEIELAMSTQLFNDRLSVDGSVGNNSNAAAQNSSNIVGDFNVEYQLTKDGAISLKAYNRANNSYLSANPAPYTQGVGVAYKKEFSSLKQLFRNSRRH